MSDKNVTTDKNVNNLTGDVKQIVKKDKVSIFIIGGGIVLFLLAYVFYFFIDYDTEGKPAISNFTRLLFIWGSLYFIVFIINFLINDVTASSSLFLRIFFIVSIAFWGITGSTFMAISLIPNLVEIFENTVGYNWINMFYNLKEKMKIIKSRTYPNFDVPSHILITKFDEENFNNMFSGLMEQNVSGNTNEMVLDFFIDVKPDDINKKKEVQETLFQLVKVKQKMGHFTWIYLSSFASMIVSLIAMNENLLTLKM